MPVLHAFDIDAEFDVRQRNLPHWRQRGVCYFVTFRLADSLPQSVLRQLRYERNQWLAANASRKTQKNAVAFRQLFSEKIEKYLAAGYGKCWMRRPQIAKIVADALEHFDGQRYTLDDYVVMPNHVHVLAAPIDEHELSDIQHSWKSFTANRINKLVGHQGQLWQEEAYDHIVRDDEELTGYRKYIADNPVKANLSLGEFLLATKPP